MHQPKRPSENDPKDKIVHSLTTYLPRANNAFLVRAIKAESTLLFGISGLGKTSRYIIGLVMRDLTNRGYFTVDGQPDEKVLVDTLIKIHEEHGIRL